MHDVAVVKYKQPVDSLRQAINLVDGLGDVSADSKVAVKLNVCVWHEGVNFPKYGVLTTARLIEDLLILLKERGVHNITLVEGVTENEITHESQLLLAAKAMGWDILVQRYGVNIVDVHQGSFTKVTRGGISFSVNSDILEADHVINMPVLKTHGMVKVSLGVKNLKGLLNVATRKKCHDADRSHDLNHYLAKLAQIMPPSLTVIDGIYTLERGPSYGGLAHRSDIIIASRDMLAADKVGARMLGFEPNTIDHLVLLAQAQGRPSDLTDTHVLGEVDINTALSPHQWSTDRSQSGDLPLALEKMGIKGIRIPPPDNTLCTYCARLFIDYIMAGIVRAQNRDHPFDDIELLYTKLQKPTLGHKHTLLVGQCQIKKNSNNPLINHCVTIGGCPPRKQDLPEAYRQLGIQLPEDFLEEARRGPETVHGRKYRGKLEFDENFYRVQ